MDQPERIVHIAGPAMGLETLCKLCGRPLAHMAWQLDQPVVESIRNGATMWYGIDEYELMLNPDLIYCRNPLSEDSIET